MIIRFFLSIQTDSTTEYAKGHHRRVYSWQLSICWTCYCNPLRPDIITIRSFSWWPGWLTLEAKYSVDIGIQCRKAFSDNYIDYFPPTWIGLQLHCINIIWLLFLLLFIGKLRMYTASHYQLSREGNERKQIDDIT